MAPAPRVQSNTPKQRIGIVYQRQTVHDCKKEFTNEFEERGILKNRTSTRPKRLLENYTVAVAALTIY